MSQIPTRDPGRSRGFRDLTIHDHACLLWETREEQFDAVAAYFRWGLMRGEQCLYVRDGTPEDLLLDALSERGVDVREARARDALVVIGKDEAYLKQGAFSPDWMISFLCRREEGLLEEGRFNGLRITGEMTWVLDFEPDRGLDPLRAYEARLNDEVFQGRKVAALCQYDMNRFPPETLIDAIYTHPFVVYRGTVCRNFYYIPTRDFLGQNQPRLRLARLLQNTWDRQRQEDILRENEAFASSLLNDSPNPILVTDSNGAVRYANPALQTLTGYEEKKLIGRKPPFPWWPREDRDSLSADLKKAMKGDARKVRERFQKRNGDWFYVEITSTPVFKDDVFQYYLANWLDVTAREQYEEQLRIMRAAMDSAVSGMALADMDLTLFYVNPAWLRLWGYERAEEVIGLSALRFWQDRDQAETLARKAVKQEEASATLEGARRDGSTFMAYASASIVKDDAGRPRCVMCSFMDVTDQIEFRDQEIRRIQENILANVNRLILPSLDRLTGGPLNAEQRTVLKMVESRLRDLISPFASRLSAPDLGITPREAEVAALVREGKTSDEIGDILRISRSSAMFHRRNLRRKLGLRGKKVSLRTFLLEMSG